jgi:hypothetical protein
MWHKSILCLIVPLLMMGGCGKETRPRYTAVPINGYPYPFGVSVKNLLGKSQWKVTSSECPSPYYSYHVSGSQWVGYSEVVLTADSLGTLQAFSATRPFPTESDARAYLADLSAEIWRRYGTQTDSTREKKTVLARLWRDQSGSVVGVSAQGGVVRVKAVSGRIERECPAFLDTTRDSEQR